MSRDLHFRPVGGFWAGLDRIGHENPHHRAALRCVEAGMPLPQVERAALVELIDELIARIEAVEGR